eukprot:TRINITY_DN15747_c0_g1_i1.p1 TRINITY_DN15747_c0_g1~~TRINITY_DN15747_c0_g1_i1.p1  ORF type:complete len:511 (+),score=153.53 TRINITY_DN15747_c0_g1_i1:225-1757(+)
MGGDSSKQLQQQMRQVDPESQENYIGLENFGNTCYMNSVLQALYWCRPFRQALLRHAEENPQVSPPRDKGQRRGGGSAPPEGGGVVLHRLSELFNQLQGNKKRFGCVAPQSLVHRIRQQNVMFAGLQQQDAHEFLVYVLNDLTDAIRGHMKEAAKAGGRGASAGSSGGGQQGDRAATPQLPRGASGGRQVLRAAEPADPLPPVPEHLPGQPNAKSAVSSPESRPAPSPSPPPGIARDPLRSAGSDSVCSGTPLDLVSPQEPPNAAAGKGRTDSEPPTLVQELFEGHLAAETRCLNCDAVTSKEEEFMGLSVDVAPNVSLQRALRSFSTGETMDRDNKFHCDKCRCLQEARRSLRIKRAPQVLAIHLKRFKYIEELGRHCKLSYRVPFPHELRLPMEGEQSDDVYYLFAVVIHLGLGPNMGHYICMAKTGGQWMMFDDDIVRLISEREVAQVYGVSTQTEASTQTGYLLFYSVDPFAQAPPVSPAAAAPGAAAQRLRASTLGRAPRARDGR